MNNNHSDTSGDQQPSQQNKKISFNIKKTVNVIVPGGGGNENKDDEALQFEDALTRKDILKKEIPSKERHAEAEEEKEEAWLSVGLIIRIKNSTLNSGHYKGKTGMVKEVVQEWGGEIHLLQGNDIIVLDQDDCECVGPDVGKEGLIVKGEYRGIRGRLVGYLAERELEVELMEGPKCGHRILLPQSFLCRHLAIDNLH